MIRTTPSPSSRCAGTVTFAERYITHISIRGRADRRGIQSSVPRHVQEAGKHIHHALGETAVINCIMIDAEMYGMMPRAKMLKRSSAPPENMLNIFRMVPLC